MTSSVSGSVWVLRTSEEAVAGRAWLRERCWDIRQHRLAWGLAYARLVLAMGRRPYIDQLKSWDVALFARVLTESFPSTAAILDVGSVGSELPWTLHLASFRNLLGCDVDPKVRKMPFAGSIGYHVGEMHNIGLADGTLDAITAVSTVEHGVDIPAFLRTAAVLLRPGGMLCISTDYWPEKISTDGLFPFGMPWTIFSELEIERLIAEAADVGLALNDCAQIPPADEAPVSWNGKQYTFIALVFERR